MSEKQGNANITEVKLEIEQAPLEYADTAEVSLATHRQRLEKNDRQIFARNLGRMTARIDIRLSELFRKAFAELGDDFYKRRKAFICKPNEDCISGLRTMAYEYLALARAVAEVDDSHRIYDSDRDRVRLNILRLVDGSSFDFNETRMGVWEVDQRQELFSYLDKVIEKVRTAVDIDWMYEWSENANHLTQTMSIDSSVAFPVNAPCTEIARVYSFVPSKRGLILDIDKSVFDMDANYRPDQSLFSDGLTAVSNWEEIIVKQLIMQYGDGQLASDEKTIKSVLYDEDHDRLFDHIPGASDKFRDDLCFSFPSFIDLELRFDQRMSRWQPILLWRHKPKKEKDGLGCPDHDNILASYIECHIPNLYGRPSKAPTGLAVHQLAICLQSEQSLHVAYLKSWTADFYRFFLFEAPFLTYDVLDEIFDMPLRGMSIIMADNYDAYAESESRELAINRENYENFIMSSVEQTDHVVIAESNEFIGRHLSDLKINHVPAPEGSIAEIILQNLAFAEPEKRIDNLLIEDARNKFSRMQKAAADSQNAFREAMKQSGF